MVRNIRDIGVTILIVEHFMEIVMPLADRATVRDLGHVLFDGNCPTLRVTLS